MPKELEEDITQFELNDDDLDTDLDEAQPAKVEEEDKTPKVGQQDDGSVVVELEEDASAKEDTPPKEEEEDKDEDEREAIRERRRQEKIERRNRAKEREERTRRELQEAREQNKQLAERLAVIERKSTGAEMAQLERAIADTKKAQDYFKDQIRVGQETGNGQLVADATEKMVVARERIKHLGQVAQAFQQRQQTPAPLDNRLVSNADRFMKKHPWFKTDGNDDDSVVLRALDNKVAAEGWDPTTEAYWNELETRVKKHLPHRAKGATMQHNDTSEQGDVPPRTKPKSVVAGSGRESSASAGGKATFTLSPERVAALKEAGMWDDPKQRSEAVKRFRDFDKANKGAK